MNGAIRFGITLPAVADAAGLSIDGTDRNVTIRGNNAVRVMRADGGSARDVKAVHAGVTALLQAGILRRGANERIAFPFDVVKVGLLLRAA